MTTRANLRTAFLALACATALGASTSAVAAPGGTSTNAGPRPAKPVKASGLGELGSSREPIKIDADRLDVYDKEGRAVFTGNVVAVQGETTMHCSVMNVFYEQRRGAAGEKQASVAGPGNDSAIKRIECSGPVTIATKTQTATGDRAEFDRIVNKVYLIGNAALSDGPNVTRGQRVAYDLNTGVANVEGGRVRALIVPAGKDEKDRKGSKKEAAQTKAR